MVNPHSVLDMGCGVGTWLAVALEYRVSDVIGVDGPYVEHDLLQIPADRFISGDLTQEIDLKRSFDLVISLEVAEHLPARCADVFVDNLVRHGPVILFSAALPSGSGTGHVNEQWPAYWAERFERRGYEAIDCLRRLIWNNPKIEWWYRQNTILYAKSEYLASHPKLREEHKRYQGIPLPLVHPDLFESVRHPKLTLRDLARSFPGAVKRNMLFWKGRILPTRRLRPPRQF